MVGGAAVYAEALAGPTRRCSPRCTSTPDGDTHYPEFDRAEWVEVRREPHLDAEIPHEIVWFERA